MLTAADVTVLALRAAAIVTVLQAAGIALFLGLLGEVLDRSDRRLRRATRAAAAAAGLLLLLQHAAEPARMAATFTGVWDWTLQQALLESNAGAAHALRLFGLILIAWSAARSRRIGRRIGLVGAIVTLASFLLTGHTAADQQRWLLVVLLLAHVALAAFWFGALLALRIASTHESLAATGEVIRRFSTIARPVRPRLT